MIVVILFLLTPMSFAGSRSKRKPTIQTDPVVHDDHTGSKVQADHTHPTLQTDPVVNDDHTGSQVQPDHTHPTLQTAHAQQTVQTNPIDESVETETISCIGCLCDYKPSEIGIRCENACHLCFECSDNYKRIIFDDTNPGLLSPKCSNCKGNIVQESFESRLNEKDLEKYLELVIKEQGLRSNEVILSCPFCTNFEVGAGSKADNPFVHCSNSECRKVSCTFCNQECVRRPYENRLAAEERFRSEHRDCAIEDTEFGHLIPRFDQVLASGVQKPCPGCGYAGNKDDACTHMHCAKCPITWCFICELDTASNLCSKGPGFGPACYRHNNDWDTRQDRCPMYLSQINDVDRSWPQDDKAAQTMLLRKCALRNLRKLYNEIGEEQYDRLIQKYERFGSPSGYTKQQIQAVDLDAPLIRKNHRH